MASFLSGLAWGTNSTSWHGWGQWGGHGLWFLWWLVPLFLLLVIIAVAVWALTRSKTDPGRVATTETAVGILAQRYARGEITKEQFEQMRRDVQE